MYADEYYPAFLVDKVRDLLIGTIHFIKSGVHTYAEIQEAFDTAVEAINDLQEEFEEHDIEIETLARDAIGSSFEQILTHYGIRIDVETAIGARDW